MPLGSPRQCTLLGKHIQIYTAILPDVCRCGERETDCTSSCILGGPGAEAETGSHYDCCPSGGHLIRLSAPGASTPKQTCWIASEKTRGVPGESRRENSPHWEASAQMRAISPAHFPFSSRLSPFLWLLSPFAPAHNNSVIVKYLPYFVVTTAPIYGLAAFSSPAHTLTLTTDTHTLTQTTCKIRLKFEINKSYSADLKLEQATQITAERSK